MPWTALSVFAASTVPQRLLSTVGTSAFLVEGVVLTPGIGNVSHLVIGTDSTISVNNTGPILTILPIPAAGNMGTIQVDIPSGGPNEIDLSKIWFVGNTADKLVVSYKES